MFINIVHTFKLSGSYHCTSKRIRDKLIIIYNYAGRRYKVTQTLESLNGNLLLLQNNDYYQPKNSKSNNQMYTRPRIDF